MKTKILILVLALFLVVTGVALANGVVELPRWVLGSGGEPSSGGNISLIDTIGQPVIGPSSGGDVSLQAGYWVGRSSVIEEETLVYLPLVLR